MIPTQLGKGLLKYFARANGHAKALANLARHLRRQHGTAAEVENVAVRRWQMVKVDHEYEERLGVVHNLIDRKRRCSVNNRGQVADRFA
jgi:hypothetical protein